MKKINKNKICIIFIAVIGIFMIGLGTFYFFGKSIATIDSTILKDQTIDGLSFVDANLEYEDGISTFTVTVTNENKSVYNLNYIVIKINDENSIVYNLIGYVGSTLETNESRIITASIDKDLTNATKLRYVINK